MLWKLPENLDTEKKKAYTQAYVRIMGSITRAASWILVIVVGVLLYAVFEKPIQDMLHPAKPLTAEELQEREAAMEEASATDADRIENGIHVLTGLKVAEGWEVVRGTCTACHSAALVTQNRATREGWEQMIRWMQQTQGLWDLGDNEKIILDYLAAHYAPEESGRRPNLDIAAIEWYILEL